MIDSLTTFNHRDFSARYRGTYGWFMKDDHERVLAYIAEVGDTQVVFQDVHGMNYHAYANKGSNFEFLPVTKGWFYGRDGRMFLFSRRPARQWHRGICSNNTLIYRVRPDGALASSDVNIAVLDNVFNHLEKEAYRYEDSKNCLLSKQFAVLQGNVYLYDRVIGKIVDKKIVLQEGAEMLKQELMDVVNRRGYRIAI